jgi:bifunctional enzyme CysN/CysC
MTEKTLLRFVTTGSVDDGKSTLIGRLLYETHSIFDDQYAAVAKTSRKKGYTEVDLSLLLDGLSAEREQGITIDVAYRYFESAKRKFIIADCPGHEQYTRNMVTGASTAQLALILIDARNGVQTQSKRHGLLVSLLQVPHLVVAVNKMDLVDYSERVYNEIVATYEAFSEKLDIHDITYIPVSALKGDNVTTNSLNMPWYTGFSLLQHLENAHVSADQNLVDFRFPVQSVIRPHQDFRGFAGRIVSGTIRPGEDVVILPSGRTTQVRSLVTYDGELHEASASQSVVLTLAEEIDVSRGDMIARRNNVPQIGQHIGATLCWMDATQNLEQNKSYFLKHTTRTVKAFVSRIVYKIDVNTLHRETTDTLSLNEIGRVELRTALPIFFDAYTGNRGTGNFILIDPDTQNTVAAGMIRGPVQTADELAVQEREKEKELQRWFATTGSRLNISRAHRETRNGHKAAVIWLTGYSGAGKTTIAERLERELFAAGCHTMLFDVPPMQTAEDDESKRIGELAHLFFETGHVVICASIAPCENEQTSVRALFPTEQWIDVFVKCDLDVCKRRDPHGLYKAAMQGELQEFPGISAPYGPPSHPALTVETDLQSVDMIVEQIIALLKQKKMIP